MFKKRVSLLGAMALCFAAAGCQPAAPAEDEVVVPDEPAVADTTDETATLIDQQLSRTPRHASAEIAVLDVMSRYGVSGSLQRNYTGTFYLEPAEGFGLTMIPAEEPGAQTALLVPETFPACPEDAGTDVLDDRAVTTACIIDTLAESGEFASIDVELLVEIDPQDAARPAGGSAGAGDDPT